MAYGVVLSGVVGALVRVEADVAEGLPGVTVVGLPDASVSESKQRTKVAIERLGLTWPNRRLTIGLAPAEMRKHGSGLDLPMAMAVLAATEQLPNADLTATAFIGELGLDGRLLVPRGALASALAARRAGLRRVFVPEAAAEQLQRLSGIDVVIAEDLATVVAVVTGERESILANAGSLPTPAVPEGPDLRDVRGQAQGRLGMEVAAAGGHHVALVGSPGVGKTIR
jgi:magnesium chelatase family protein